MRQRTFTASETLASRVKALLMAVACVAGCSTAFAQYPGKPVRVVMPLAAGSASDAVFRVISEPLSRILGQPIVVDNKPGADGAIGANEVARAPADGYTLLFATATPLSAGPHLHKKLAYDAMADFSPVAQFGNYTMVLAVNSRNIPAKTMQEFIQYAQKNPGKLNYGTGNGSSIVQTGSFSSMSNIKMHHVPYKGEPQVITDLVAGRLDFVLGSYNTVTPFAQTGDLRVLATTLPSRSALMPDVPTLQETGLPAMPVVSWAGLVGPVNMPKDVIARLNRDINTVLARPEVKAALAKLGFEAIGATPGEFGVSLKDQYDNWGKAIRAAGLSPQ